MKHITVKEKWCKGCALCTTFCPKSVLEIVKEKAVVVHPEQCISCGICEKLCPDYAIYFYESGEEK